MTIQISDDRRFARYWYVPGKGCDYLGMLWQLKAEGSPWMIAYRFRYYASGDGDPHNGQDRKSWYEAMSPYDEDGTIDLFDHMIEEILVSSEFAQAEATCIDLRGKTTEEVASLLLKQSETHVQETSKGGSA